MVTSSRNSPTDHTDSHDGEMSGNRGGGHSCDSSLYGHSDGSDVIVNKSDDCQDLFSRALTREGLLEFREPASGRPVLSIAHGFYNEELAAWRTSPEADHRLQISLAALPSDQRAKYVRVFSRQHPGEAAVHGLPESVWLSWLEPSLPVLANLSQIKRRKSNLSRRKSPMIGHDSCPSSHGDHQFWPQQLLGNFRLHFAVHAHRRFTGPNELHSADHVASDRRTSLGRRRRLRFRYRPYPVVPPLRAMA